MYFISDVNQRHVSYSAWKMWSQKTGFALLRGSTNVLLIHHLATKFWLLVKQRPLLRVAIKAWRKSRNLCMLCLPCWHASPVNPSLHRQFRPDQLSMHVASFLQETSSLAAVWQAPPACRSHEAHTIGGIRRDLEEAVAVDDHIPHTSCEVMCRHVSHGCDRSDVLHAPKVHSSELAV